MKGSSIAAVSERLRGSVATNNPEAKVSLRRPFSLFFVGAMLWGLQANLSSSAFAQIASLRSTASVIRSSINRDPYADFWWSHIQNVSAASIPANPTVSYSLKDSSNLQKESRTDEPEHTFLFVHDWLRVTFPAAVAFGRSRGQCGLFGSDEHSVADTNLTALGRISQPVPLLVIHFDNYDLPLTLQVARDVNY